jgi:membrane-associated phospholipid phosphatase
MLRRPAAALFAALACALATSAVWVVAFHTGAGARLDSSVLHGFTGLQDSSVEPVANAAAQLANPIPFALLSLAIVALALVRRRPLHALVVAVVVVAAPLTTELLKPVATVARPAEAPPLAPSVDGWPSGHTTAAMALALCLVLVTPARRRPLAAAIGGAFAVAQGYGLLVMGWHYPSDVLAAFGVSATWLALGVAALGLTSARAEERRLRWRTVVAPAVVTALAAAAVAACVVLLRPSRAASYVEEHPTFLTAAIALGAAGLAVAVAAAALSPAIDPAPAPARERPA